MQLSGARDISLAMRAEGKHPADEGGDILSPRWRKTPHRVETAGGGSNALEAMEGSGSAIRSRR